MIVRWESDGCTCSWFSERCFLRCFLYSGILQDRARWKPIRGRVMQIATLGDEYLAFIEDCDREVVYFAVLLVTVLPLTLVQLSWRKENHVMFVVHN